MIEVSTSTVTTVVLTMDSETAKHVMEACQIIQDGEDNTFKVDAQMAVAKCIRSALRITGDL